MSVTSCTILLFVLLIGLMISGLDLTFAIFLSSVSVMLLGDLTTFTTIAQRMVNSADSFTMIACPLFILSGFLMEESGMSQSLVEWASALFGRVRGGAGVVAIIVCMIFAALTGSGPATVAAIGGIMFPALMKAGYPKGTGAGMLAAGGSLGPLIPPSLAMIIYGTTMQVNISDLFAGAVLPGLVMTGCFLVTNWIVAKKYDIRAERNYTAKEKLQYTWKALGTLMMPILVLGSIYSGFATATEAAGIAALYSFAFCIVRKKLTIKRTWKIFLMTAETNAIGLMILNSASLFTWILTDLQIPAKLTHLMTANLSSPVEFMATMVIILLIAGCLMEPAVNIVIFAPLLIPVGLAFGYELQYLSMVFCVSLIIGFMTPPFGPNIFEAVAITKVSFHETSKGVLPFVLSSLIALLIVIMIPGLSTWLPNMLYG